MTRILRFFEVMANYGVFDILFGIGIIAFIQRLFKRRAVQDLDGIELMPRIHPLDGLFKITVKNASRDPLYFYRASFKPGYRATTVDRDSPRAFFRSLFFYSWRTDRLPRITEDSRTTRGDYLLQALDHNEDEAETLFLEPRKAWILRPRLRTSGG